MRFTFKRLTPAVAALAVLLPTAPAHAALSAVGPIDPATKAAAFYQDANGLQLGLCHPGTANCGPAVAGEDFYYMATSTLTANGGTASLTLNMTLAPNASGDPAAFNRVRAQLNGFPAGTYTITHPYGTDTVTVASVGARGRTTIDTGCLVAATGPCDFAAAMAGRFGPFLTAAPGAAAPPARFIGDAVTQVPVVGSPTGSNFFRVEGPGLPAGGVQSNTFALMGKLFGGAVPVFGSAGPGAFASQLVGTTSAAKTVTVTSSGVPGAGSNLAISGVTLSGANAGDYAIAANTCAGATLPSGSACTVGLTFTPGAAGARTATLTFTDNTAAGSHAVALSGAGAVPAPAPAAPLAPAPAVVTPAPTVAPVAPPVAKAPKLRLNGLTLSARMSLRTARHRGIRLVAFAPEGTQVVKVRLLRDGRLVTRTVRKVGADGVVTVVLPTSARGRHALRRGTYTLQVTPGAPAGRYGATTSRTVRIS